MSDVWSCPFALLDQTFLQHIVVRLDRLGVRCHWWMVDPTPFLAVLFALRTGWPGALVAQQALLIRWNTRVRFLSD